MPVSSILYYFYVRCLTASKSKIAALTETLSESNCPSMGMRIWAS